MRRAPATRNILKNQPSTLTRKRNILQARDELLQSVTEVGLRRGMSQLTMCATTGFTVDETMSLRRNQRQDPREKLSMTAAEDVRPLGPKP
jgi:hypothetical protein